MNADIIAQIKFAQSMSRCPRRSVGYVLFDREMKQMAIGYNSPVGDKDCYLNKCSPMRGKKRCIAVHAEINALRGFFGDLYYAFGSRSPCYVCASALISAGVKEIYVLTTDGNRMRNRLLHDHNVQMRVC